MIPTPIPTLESESESSFDSDSGVGIAPGLSQLLDTLLYLSGLLLSTVLVLPAPLLAVDWTDSLAFVLVYFYPVLGFVREYVESLVLVRTWSG